MEESRFDNSARGQRHFVLHSVPDWLWGPLSLLYSGYGGVKRPGLEGDHDVHVVLRMRGAIPPL
jgi:hypothetical protein